MQGKFADSVLRFGFLDPANRTAECEWASGYCMSDDQSTKLCTVENI